LHVDTPRAWMTAKISAHEARMLAHTEESPVSPPGPCTKCRNVGEAAGESKEQVAPGAGTHVLRVRQLEDLLEGRKRVVLAQLVLLPRALHAKSASLSHQRRQAAVRRPRSTALLYQQYSTSVSGQAQPSAAPCPSRELTRWLSVEMRTRSMLRLSICGYRKAHLLDPDNLVTGSTASQGPKTR